MAEKAGTELAAVPRVPAPVPAGPPTLTAMQERFAQAFVACGSAARAYRAVRDCKRMSRATSKQRGYELRHQPLVAARIRELLAQSAGDARAAAQARMAILTDIVEADPGEVVRIVSECCRWCHGAGHAYQWTDGAEYAQALSVALAAQRVRPRGERQLPTEEGGYGFDAGREPHEKCPRCRGEGVQRVQLTPTDRLSPAARRLLKGVVQKASGEVQVRFHDPLEAMDILNRMQGVYVERSVSLTAHMAVPPPTDWTRDEQLAFLESLRPAP